jgi:hypothetical protein
MVRISSRDQCDACTFFTRHVGAPMDLCDAMHDAHVNTPKGTGGEPREHEMLCESRRGEEQSAQMRFVGRRSSFSRALPGENGVVASRVRRRWHG